MNAFAAAPATLDRIAPSLPMARRLRRILFATDFSRESFNALPIVGALAKRYDAHVEVFHALAPTPIVVPEGATYTPVAAIEAEQKIHEVLKADVLDGRHVSWAVRLGLAAETIMDEAVDQKADLIVLGTHGYSGLRHFLMGSVCEELARSAPCPVLTVGPHVDKRFANPERTTRILVPVDFTPESLEVVPSVLSLASDFDTCVTFLHVRKETSSGLPSSRAKHFVGMMRRMFQHHVPDRCTTRYLVEDGDPASTILAVAYETFADVIAMGVRAKKDVPFQLRSSVTYRVIAGAQCPVLISHLH
jgi:nucleotide-binding universal stress UspA family protein